MNAAMLKRVDVQTVFEEPAIQDFLRPNFNHTDYASSVLKDNPTSASDRISGLKSALAQLQHAIRHEVTSKQDTLLSHVRQLQEQEAALAKVNTSVATLSDTARRVKDDIEQPYEVVQRHATKLANLHHAMELLRAVNHHVKQTAKLKQLMAGGQGLEAIDLAKAAKLLHELDISSPDGGLYGISIVDSDAQFITDSRARVEGMARTLLGAGMSSLGQAEVASALQVFFNLGNLQQTVRATVSRAAEEVEGAWRGALDARRLSGLSTGTSSLRPPAGAGSSVHLQEALWQALEGALSKLHRESVAIWHLQRVVAKKRDPLTLTAFLDVVQVGDHSILDLFWTTVASSLSKLSAAAAAHAGVIRDALTHGFPRLYALFETTLERIVRDSEVPGTASALSPAQQTLAARALTSFQERYLSASLARMQEAVNSLFPASARTLPRSADVQKFIGTLHDEVKPTVRSPSLSTLMAIAVSKALALMCARCSMLSGSAQELKSLAGAATTAQLRNLMLYSRLHEVHRSFVTLLSKLPPAAGEVLCTALEHVQSHAVEPVLPIFKSAAEDAERLLLDMHKEDWAKSSGGAVMGTSTYVQNLGSFLQHFRLDYLSKFTPPPSPNIPSFAALLCQRLAARLLMLFVRHAALLKPLSKHGKLQLAKDISELEQAVRQNLYPTELLRDAYTSLRGFRSLIFAETSELLAAPQSLPVSIPTMLFHLFSRLPEQAQLPHQRASVTPKAYAQWMSQHSGTEIVASISTAFDAAVKVPGADQQVLEVMRLLIKQAAM